MTHTSTTKTTDLLHPMKSDKEEEEEEEEVTLAKDGDRYP